MHYKKEVKDYNSKYNLNENQRLKLMYDKRQIWVDIKNYQVRKRVNIILANNRVVRKKTMGKMNKIYRAKFKIKTNRKNLHNQDNQLLLFHYLDALLKA